ncbi:DNA ligase [Ideonella sp. BN130291]|uniref:DNA ligase n=1 Tax=Ideonella sp. BN130291 TaxID=3112940 RepID=UPI002E26CC63|nr:DNA ligase [Ideonella sp. BN130291]
MDLTNPARRRLAGGGLAWLVAPSLAAATPQGTAAFGAGPRPQVPLAHDCPPGFDPTGYLVSEKFDGVRALWDGEVLRFRSGQPVHAPAWFTAALPAQALDGELWMARGRFEALAGAVRRELPRDEEWRQISYRLFELPGAPGPFSARNEAIGALVQRTGFAALVQVEQQPLRGPSELRRRLAEVVAAGGEGLMLHRADAPYRSGRSDALLKLKPLNDADAVVLAHLPGQGKYDGQLGALRVRMDGGPVFDIGTGLSDAQRLAPPPVGATITFTHRGFTRTGVPRFASFLRVRLDA